MSVLGIEFGSTRIKGVLIDENRRVMQSGVHDWENRMEDGYWTYSLDEVWAGVKDVVSQIDTSDVTAVGISAMMHGYLAFDKSGELLTPFRTWRNTNTEIAAAKLTELFNFNIPLRWSVAHLYQAILDGEEHVKDIDYITTLAGYVHWKLTGERVLGIGDASGMFPIEEGGYNVKFVRQFEELTGIDWTKIAPKVLKGGAYAGTCRGIPFCPPEGDAETGMVATNSIAPCTGSVSAGTSIFAMVVLEKPLDKLHREIDIVTTPTGDDVAMIHCNECTVKIDPWINLFWEAFSLMGLDCAKSDLFSKLYEVSLDDGKLAQFMREILESAVSDLADGIKILTEQEKVTITSLAGHGGFFKSGSAGQTIMSKTLNIPVTISETAAEGGAWGIALLAEYLKCSKERSLQKFLSEVMKNV
ncbi:MAG: ATPase [Oscillospiraceae bacterium]|jgi:sugar (pentulose or hexulose) kinase|nr:ATPase [Oscillospiraceae bacterium]